MAASHVPTSDELSDVVADILIDLDNSNPTPHEVLVAVQKRKASWNVFENQITKSLEEYNIAGTRRGEFGPLTDDDDYDDDSVRSGASRGSAATATTACSSSVGGGSVGDRSNNSKKSRFNKVVKGTAATSTTAAKPQLLGITRLDRRKMHFIKAPPKIRPHHRDRNRGNNNNDCSENSTSDNTGDDLLLSSLTVVGQTTKSNIAAMDHKDSPEDDAKVQKVPPRRPQRTISDSSDREEDSTHAADDPKTPVSEKMRALPARNSSFAEVDVEKIANGTAFDSKEGEDDDDDADIIEEADKRSKFMMKGGSHSIQKVLKGEARRKKGFSRFDRRTIKKSDNGDTPAGEVGAEDQSDKDEQTRPAVPSDVLDSLGDSYSENALGESYSDNIDIDTDDGEEFAAEVARRSKFIAKGGSHSIKKVLAGEARSGGKKSGPSRINRRNIPSRPSPSGDSNSTTTANATANTKAASGTTTEEENKKPSRSAPIRTISCDSTDSQIEDEANKRSRFMLKGASHSIRNLLAGKTKKEKGLSRLDRKKMQFKHAADAVHYTEKEHLKPEQINNARLKAEAEAKEKAAAKKAARQIPRRPKRMMSMPKDKEAKEEEDEPSAPQEDMEASSSHQDQSNAQEDNEDDSEIVAEVDRRSLLFKGGSHSIRNLFAGKGKKSDGNGGGGIGRFNRRKMHFQKEAESVHYNEKPHLKPAEINARHQQEAARLRSEEKVSDAPKAPYRRISADSDHDSRLDLGDEQTKKAVYAEIEALHGDGGGDEESDKGGADLDDDEDLDADEDILEEANLRSNFILKGGSYSIQKVLRGDAQKKEGVTRFDRRKMHFKHEAEAIHSHDHGGEKKEAAANSGVESEATKSTIPDDPALECASDDDSDDSADSDILEEANHRSKFMMKGGSYSIQKVLRGEARAKKEGVTRFDRRKMHFKHESEAIHCHDHDGEEQHDSKHDKAENAGQDDSQGNSTGFDDDEDADIIEEANKRSKFMMKGGSHSIQKVLRGEARKKDKEGVTRFDRRKMHFKKDKNASQTPAGQAQTAAAKRKDAPVKAPMRIRTASEDLDASESASPDKSSNSEEFDDEELELLKEAESDPRRAMMLKGASHSIRNIFSGKAKKKEKSIAAGMERRKSQLKNASIRAGLGDNSNEFLADENLPLTPKKTDEDQVDEQSKDSDEKSVDRRKKFTLKGASNSIRHLLKRKHGKKEGQKAIDAEIERLHGTRQEEEVVSGDVKDKDSDAELDLDDEDREIEEEANRRSNFMAKGASYSITKVLSGSAKKKKSAINRFDRRKMHFQNEAKAVHSHDGQSKASPTSGDSKDKETSPVKTSEDVEDPSSLAREKLSPDDAVADDLDDDLDDEDTDLVEEADRRSKFMSKGGSYSIQKVLKGEARAKKGVSRFDRRKMHFKKESSALHCHDNDGDKTGAQPPSLSDPAVQIEQQPESKTLPVPSQKQPPLVQSTNAKMPSRRISDGEGAVENDYDEQKDSTAKTAEELLDDGEAEADLEEAGDRRKRFTLRGASHSIKKVLAGKARGKKDSGVSVPSRLDRRRIHLKSKSAPRADSLPKSPG